MSLLNRPRIKKDLRPELMSLLPKKNKHKFSELKIVLQEEVKSAKQDLIHKEDEMMICEQEK